jgi:hypothetical protein
MPKRMAFSAARAPLAYIRDNCFVLRVLSTAAINYAQTTGNSGNQLVSANVSAADFSIASGSTGPVMTVAQKTNHPVEVSGQATHIAITRTSGTSILILTNCSNQTLAAGHFVDIPSWTITSEQSAGTAISPFTPPDGAVEVNGTTLAALNAAIAATPSGGTTYIGDRTITLTGGGFPTINKSITLLGNGTTSKIVGSGNWCIWIQDTTNVTVRGIELDGSNNTGGIFLFNTNNVVIENNVIHNLFHSGVFGASGTGVLNQNITVRDNYFYNTQRQGQNGKAAIQTQGGGTFPNCNTAWAIQRNTVLNSAHPVVAVPSEVGLGLDQITNSLIEGNFVTMSGFFEGAPWGGEGITVVGWGNRIFNNRVRGNNAGGISLLSYQGSGTVSAVTVSGNNVKGNGGTNPQGIALVKWDGGDLRNIVIENNTCSGSSYGIQSYDVGFGPPNGLGTIVVRNNDFSGNVTGGCNFIVGTGVSATSNIAC